MNNIRYNNTFIMEREEMLDKFDSNYRELNYGYKVPYNSQYARQETASQSELELLSIDITNFTTQTYTKSLISKDANYSLENCSINNFNDLSSTINFNQKP